MFCVADTHFLDSIRRGCSVAKPQQQAGCYQPCSPHAPPAVHSHPLASLQTTRKLVQQLAGGHGVIRRGALNNCMLHILEPMSSNCAGVVSKAIALRNMV